ncbi:MAG: sulfatase-like hydrolase/transferase [Ilumatobacteraceae bacterium]
MASPGDARRAPLGRELLSHFAVYVTLATVALAQPLLQLYGENIAVFAAADFEGWGVLWFATAWAFLPAVAMSLVELAVRLFSRQAAAAVHVALVATGAWACWLVILRTVSIGAWVADLALTGALGAAVAWLYARRRSLRTWLVAMSPLGVVVVTAFAVSANAVIWPPDVGVVAVASTTTSPEPTAVDPSTVSVVWIVLDEAPLFPLLTTDGNINDKRFPGFAALARESTWFRNALATSQTTTDSVPSMLTGKWPVSGVAPVLAKHRDNAFTLMNGRLPFDAHEVATALCPKPSCQTVSVTGGDHIAFPGGREQATASTTTVPTVETVAARGVDLRGFVRDAWVVVGHKMLPAGLREGLPAIDEGWGGFGAVDDVEYAPADELVPGDDSVSTSSVPLTEEQQQKAESTTVMEWQAGGPMSQVPVLEGVTRRAARADRPTFHFAHVLLPHRPWMLAPDGRRSRAIPTDKRSNEIVDRVRDEYQAHLLQYSATDTLVGDLVSSLKQSANWDRTLLIVTADHGITFEPGESKRKTIDPTSPGTLDDIYRVPLFVKFPGQVDAEVSDCPTSGVDLLPTVIGATGLDPGWELDGVDLGVTCPERQSRRVVWPDGEMQITSSFASVVERARRYDPWIDAEGDVDDIVRAGVHGSLVGSSTPAGLAPVGDLEWSLDRPDDFTRVGEGQFGFVPTQVQGRVTANRDFAADEEGLLVVDGVAVGVVSEVAGLRRGESTVFRSTLLARAIQPGDRRVEMWLASGQAQTAKLVPVAL